MLQTHIHGKDAIKMMESITVADIQGLKNNQVDKSFPCKSQSLKALEPPPRCKDFLKALFFFGSVTPCASPPLRPFIFSSHSFLVHHPVNRDDRHLLSHAMASDFTVAWQCSSKRTICFFPLRIKLHAKALFFKLANVVIVLVNEVSFILPIFTGPTRT
jgi:hypothetical protein